MSATKKILFGGGLESEPFKSEWSAELDELRARLTIRIPTRRKNRFAGRRWDPLWPSCLQNAARELGIEAAKVNDGLLVRTQAAAELVNARAAEMWEEQANRFRPAAKRIDF